MQYCVCGKKMESISCIQPWRTANYDSKGNVIWGICVHGEVIKPKEDKLNSDTKFIKHIQSHLREGQEVVCKICGKTAKEILNETNV